MNFVRYRWFRSPVTTDSEAVRLGSMDSLASTFRAISIVRLMPFPATQDPAIDAPPIAMEQTARAES